MDVERLGVIVTHCICVQEAPDSNFILFTDFKFLYGGHVVA
jgi:hypothetical protein